MALRNYLLLSLALGHFALGVASPYCDSLACRAYRRVGLAQWWGMFAVPARYYQRLSYATKDKGSKWSAPANLVPVEGDQLRRGGIVRLQGFYQPNVADLVLEDVPEREAFYRELSTRFCGRQPSPAAVRFYLAYAPIRAQAGEGEKTVPIYERDCAKPEGAIVRDGGRDEAKARIMAL